MLKPINRQYIKDDLTSILYFDKVKDLDPTKPMPKDGKYYMRGGICFPMMAMVHAEKEIQGFAVMCGLEVDTGLVWVFEQQEFITVDNILDWQTGNVEYKGLSHWFNIVWQKYFANHYYFFQDYELSKKYRLDILRSEMIQPKPFFVEVPWSDHEQASISIWSRTKTGTILYKSGSDLHTQLGEAKHNDKNIRPAVHALQCAIVGLDRYPYRKREVAA